MGPKPMRALLMVVLALTATGCAAPLATPGPTPHPFPRPGEKRGPDPNGTELAAVADSAAPRPSAGGYEISGTALTLRGAPYRDGGADPNGFDCSGFVWYVFGTHGVALPRTVSDQARWGEKVDGSDLRPGDLVFFSTTAPGPSHVGIVIGGDSFVHAPSSSGVVRVERLSASYWSSRFVGARRVV
jgi:cell wall-associated NlpC family hydrolase